AHDAREVDSGARGTGIAAGATVDVSGRGHAGLVEDLPRLGHFEGMVHVLRGVEDAPATVAGDDRIVAPDLLESLWAYLHVADHASLGGRPGHGHPPTRLTHPLVVRDRVAGDPGRQHL